MTDTINDFQSYAFAYDSECCDACKAGPREHECAGCHKTFCRPCAAEHVCEDDELSKAHQILLEIVEREFLITDQQRIEDWVIGFLAGLVMANEHPEWGRAMWMSAEAHHAPSKGWSDRWASKYPIEMPV